MPIIGIEEIQRLELRMLKDTIAVLDAHNIPYFGLYGTALGAVRHQGAIPWDCDVDLGIPYSHYRRMVECLREHLGPEYTVPYYDSKEPYYFLFARVAYTGVSHAHIHIDLFPMIGAPSEKTKQLDMLAAFNEIFKYHPMKKKKPVWGRTTLRRVVKQTLYNLRQWLYPKTIEQLEQEYQRMCEALPFDEAPSVFIACPDEGELAFAPLQWYGEGVDVPYGDLVLKIPSQYEQYLKYLYGEYLEYPSAEEREAGLNFVLDVPQSVVGLLN